MVVAIAVVGYIWLKPAEDIPKGKPEENPGQNPSVNQQLRPTDEVKEVAPTLTEEQKKLAAIQLINHISWVISRITHYNDKCVLDEEYRELTADAINLNLIPDTDARDLILAVLDAIKEIREQAGDKELFDKLREIDLENAFTEAIPSPSVLIATNPATLVTNLAFSAVSSYSNYKRKLKEIEVQKMKNDWEGQKKAMTTLHNLHGKLLTLQFDLMKTYKIPDEWRTGVEKNGTSHLIDKLKDTTTIRLEFLRQEEGKYAKLPQYWYHRGVACMDRAREMVKQPPSSSENTAMQVKAEIMRLQQEADECFDHFQSDFLPLFRFNKMTASTALNRVQLELAKENPDHNKVNEQLALVEKSWVRKDDFDLIYATAVAHKSIGQIDEALKVAGIARNELESRMKTNLQDITYNNSRDDYKKNAPLPTLTLTAAQSFIGSIYASDPATYKSELEQLVNNENTLATAQLLLSGKIPIKDLENMMAKKLKGIELVHEGSSSGTDKFSSHVPIEWFNEGKAKTSLRLVKTKGESRPKWCHTADEDEAAGVSYSETIRRIKLKYKLEADTIIDEESDEIWLCIDHKSFPLHIVFDTTPILEEGKRYFTTDHESLSVKAFYFEATDPAGKKYMKRVELK